MEGIKLERRAKALYSRCEHGECPICIDATSGCPVMELCQKPCMDIRMNDWLRWLESENCHLFDLCVT